MNTSKAPDKIYVTIDRPEKRVEYNPELVGVAWLKKDKSCEHHEYIRKDLLLAWAKQKQYESTTIVADNFWQEVIDKINSL